MKPDEKCMKGGQAFDKSRGEPRPKADARSCTQAPLGAGNTLVHKAGAVAAGGHRELFTVVPVCRGPACGQALGTVLQP
ncbi:hypothetical protein D3C72_1813430 [compost metagenome]